MMSRSSKRYASKLARRNATVLLAAVLGAAVLCVPAYGKVTWVLKSSTMGHLPTPNAGEQQTCCVVCDIDKDGKLVANLRWT